MRAIYILSLEHPDGFTQEFVEYMNKDAFRRRVIKKYSELFSERDTTDIEQELTRNFEEINEELEITKNEDGKLIIKSRKTGFELTFEDLLIDLDIDNYKLYEELEKAVKENKVKSVKYLYYTCDDNESFAYRLFEITIEE